MNDLIYRDQAIEAISKLPVKVDNLGYTWMIAGDALKQLDDIPPAEPEERTAKVTDTWKIGGYDELNAWCPECEHRITRECSYCPTLRSIQRCLP